MRRFSTSSMLATNYAAYYEGPSEWRWLSSQDKAANIERLCHGIPHRTILDIGAGEGSTLQRLSDRGFGETLFALEVSTSGLQAIAARGIPALRGCVLYDGYSVPFADGAFDLVVLTHLLEHLEYPRALLYEARRVARHVFVEVPLDDTLRMRADHVWTKTGHINFYSPKTIRRLLQTCGLEIISQEITNPSLMVYRKRFGAKGVFRFLLKEIPLTVWPAAAAMVFGYHGCLLCRSAA
jgi:SAM-dependent methyltransferase